MSGLVQRHWFGLRFENLSGGQSAAFEEPPRRTFAISELGGGLFLHWHQFVSSLSCLLVEPRLNAFFAHRIALRPKRCVVFNLPADHAVRDDGDFVPSSCRRGCRSSF